MNADIAQCSQQFQRIEGPNWRFTLAKKLARDTSPWLEELSDPLVRDTAAYLQSEGTNVHASRESDNSCARISAAMELWQVKQMQQTLIMLVLGDFATGDIALRLGQEEDVVATTEALYFDVRRLHTSRVSLFWANAHKQDMRRIKPEWPIPIQSAMAAPTNSRTFVEGFVATGWQAGHGLGIQDRTPWTPQSIPD